MKRLTSVFGNGGARFARVWSIVSVSSLLATAVWSQSLTWLGTLGGDDSVAFDVSADGRDVVGASTDAAGQRRAFRWQNGRMQDLGTLQGYDRFAARAVSADGSAVVGTAETADGSRRRAFLWTAPWGMQDLGTLGGAVSRAFDISPDGTIVVGEAQGPSGVRAFRWTAAEGMRDLGTLPGYSGSLALGVSADGSVVVGYANLRESSRAFRWTADGGMVDLGTLPGYAYTVARRTSADGSVVVGYCFNRDNQGQPYQFRAFRWTADGRMQDLGTLGGNESRAYGVSADGSVVVGDAQNSAGQWRACRWTERGIEDLNTTYAELLAPGSYLERAYGLSPDGRYIVGRGFNAATGRTEAYLLDTRCVVPADVNDDGAVNDADLLQVLFNFGTGCNN